MLLKLGLPYDSPEALELSEKTYATSYLGCNQGVEEACCRKRAFS